MPTTELDGLRSIGVAVLAVAVAAVLRYAIGLLEPTALYFAMFYPAVLLATLVGGLRAGIVATVLSLLVVWYVFLPPAFTFDFKERATVINISMFAASSSLLVWLADSYRTALQSLARVDRERRLLMEEMRHRSRNSLTVTQTIIASTFKCSPEMMATVMGRLRAVLSSEALLLDAAQAGEQLRDIVNSELLAFGQDRYEAVGSEVVLTARHARSWALIVHELATNSAKHGALREAEGKVLVTWFLKQDFLDFEWREVGASLSSGASASPGFGTKLIDAMVKSVGGEISRQFENDGLRVKILVPVENLTTRHDQGEKVQEPPTAKLQPILH